MTLGQKLKTLLKEKNMTQEELAEQLDVSRQAVGKWVNDKGIPEVTKLIQISNMFGVSLDYLLKEEGREGSGAESGYYVSGEMLEGYLSCEKQKRERIIGGLSLIMLANIFVENNFAEMGRSVRVGMEGVYWAVTLAGLALLIWQCFQTKKYREIRNEKLIFDSKVYEAFKNRREKERKKYAVMMIAGIALLVVGSDIIAFLGSGVEHRLYRASAGILEWVLDTAGLAFILWSFLSVRAESVVVRNTEDTPQKGTGRFTWVYWALPVTAILFLVGVISNIWSPMAPVIILFCALLVTVCKLLLEKREKD